MKRFLSTGVLGVALLALASTAGAQTWTAVAASGDIRDNSLSTYATANGILQFRTGATGLVQAVFNVTNPRDSGNPLWTTLEFRAQQPGGLGVGATALLVRQPRFSNSALTVCSAVIPAGPVTTATCTFPAGSLDFTNNYYYVHVSLSRTATTQSVFASGVRIF